MTKKRYDSLDLKVNLKLDGQALTLSGYSASALLSDETKGKVTVTVTDADGDVVNDANGSPLDHLTMYANGSIFSQAILTAAYGIATAGQYIVTYWYHKKASGVLSSRHVGTVVLTITDEVAATAPS